MSRIINKIFPTGTKRRKALSKSKKRLKKICISFYKIIPFKNLKKILKKSANKVGMYNNEKELIINTEKSIKVIDKYNDKVDYCFELEEINSSIAIHLHLYYKDLLDEMISYLNNMPFKFDLFVSVMDNDNNNLIKDKLKSIKNINKITLKVSKNSGRDYGPMMVEFGQILGKYDYVGHIHTKKSLRMGKEQSEWRTHLLKGILGNESLIRKIFYLFEKENIGIFFPDSIDSAPYWSHTWMGVKSLGRTVLENLRIPYKDTYQDFSVGSMFWVRTKSCEQVFSKKWSYQDFGEEQGLNDGTLAYVFERIFVLNSNHNNYDFVCYNILENVFYKNYSVRNRHDYYKKNIDTLYNKLKDYEIVSFDIFDTLITRKIYSPDDLFKLMAKKIKSKKINTQNFLQLRKQAEISASSKKNIIDPSIHDIYNEFKKLNNLSEKETNIIKDLEISLEKEFLIPRLEMVELFNRLKKNGNTIIITSDMYLPSDILKEILKKCGFTGYKKIYVSCETKLRKDKGDIWPYLKEKYQGKSFIHVGDDEESDIHKAWDFDITNEHIMQGKKMFDNTSFGYFNRKTKINDSILSSIVFGLIINKKLYNSPFRFNKTNNKYEIEDLNQFGYAVVGPIILEYLLWVIKTYNKNEKLLFLAREGYYFEKLFDQLCKGLKLKNIDKMYFNTSRRSVTVANIKDEKDIYDLLDIEFYGNMKSFMHYRFGVEYKDKNFNIILCHDNPDNNYDQVKNEVIKYKDEILKNAENERKNYLNYINKNIKKLRTQDLCVIDLGYSGTIQTFLSKLMNKKISGKYLVVKNNPKPLKIGCRVESCFNELKNDNNHVLYKNSLFLECFLTAHNGQLICFNDKGEPQFIDEKLLKNKIPYLEEIYLGAKELIDDVLELAGDILLEEDINKEVLVNNYKAFLLESNHFVDNFKTIFEFEDYYCRSEKIEISKI